MDLSFFRRRPRGFRNSSAAPLEYAVLVASLQAMQSGSAASRALRSFAPEAAATEGRYPLVELLLGGPAWAEAITEQRGCFNAAQASRR